MFNKTEKIAAAVILTVSIVLAVVGYSFTGTPSSPARVWFDASGGDIIFDHTYHTDFAACVDCHHNYQEGVESQEMSCRACHYWGEARDEKSDDPTHPRFIGANCVDCHESMDIDTGCNTCHARPGFAFEQSGRLRPVVPKKVEFDTDNGPVLFNHKLHTTEDVGESCAACHHQCIGGEMKGMECTKDCRSCHYERAAEIPSYEDEYHQRYIGANCTDCHGSDDCEFCHTG